MNIQHYDLEESCPTKIVAQRTNTSGRFWDGLRIKGGGPKFIKMSARCVRYRWGDVVEWLNSKKLTSTSEFQ